MFQQWVLEPDETTQRYWEEWISAHPEKSEAVREARTWVLNIRASLEKNTEEHFHEVWNGIRKRLEDGKISKEDPAGEVETPEILRKFYQQ